MSPLPSALALTATLAALLVSCQQRAEQQDLRWGAPSEVALEDWREYVSEQGPQRWQGEALQGVTLTYPKGTQTAVSVQVDSAGLSNVGVAEDVGGLLNHAYAGRPPASARYREEWTVGRLQREGRGINLCFHALRAGLTPEGAPQGGRSLVTVDKPMPCPLAAQNRTTGGGHGMSFRSFPLRLDEWNTLFIGRVNTSGSGHGTGRPQEWTYAVAVFPSSQPIAHEQRAEGGMTVSLDAQAGQPVEVAEYGFKTPPVPALTEMQERLQ